MHMRTLSKEVLGARIHYWKFF